MTEILKRLQDKLDIFKNNSYLKITGGIVVGIGVISFAKSKLSDYKEQKYLKSLVLRKQLEQKHQFASLKQTYCDNKSDKFDEILSLGLEELIEQLQSRKLTATEVLQVYTARAIEATEEFNCVSEFVPQSFEIAKNLDELPEVKGPLHGVPFCVKDDTHVKGIDTTVGLARNLFKPAPESATAVKILEDLGAIPFCKTNVPQTCISFSSENPIFGITVNPLNKKLSPGGSSAGTGALIGCGAVPFGLGGDTGGSARVPSHFCGISTLKPCKNRVSRKGCVQCLTHCIGLTTTPCIMAPTAKDVALIFKLTSQKNQHNVYDGKAVPIPWNSEVYESKEKLRIGYYQGIEEFPPLGDTPEIILKAKSLFESLGHTVVPFELKNSSQCVQIIIKLSSADLGSHVIKTLRNEQKSPEMEELYRLNNLSKRKRQLFSRLPRWIIRPTQYYKSSLLVSESKDLWDCMAERKVIIEGLLDRMRELQLDLILCPVRPYPAIKLDDVRKIRGPSLYTFMWNLVDFPAGVVKVGKESGKNIDAYDHQGDPNKMLAKQNIRESIGMPIGVQIVGMPFNEEKVLRAMTLLENAVRG